MKNLWWEKNLNTDLIKNNFIKDKNRTTNVNILLNRVRLNKKRDLKKKLLFYVLIVSTLSTLSFFLII